MVYSVEITADINRQTEMIEWCQQNISDGEWGMVPNPYNEPRLSTKVVVEKWLWAFRQPSDLEKFQQRWPHTQQLCLPFWRANHHIRDNMDHVIEWCKNSLDGAEIVQVKEKYIHSTWGPDPNAKYMDCLNIRFKTVEDMVQFQMVWL